MGLSFTCSGWMLLLPRCHDVSPPTLVGTGRTCVPGASPSPQPAKTALSVMFLTHSSLGQVRRLPLAPSLASRNIHAGYNPSFLPLLPPRTLLGKLQR